MAWCAVIFTIAAIKTIEGVLYVNDGDWVESCTALVEDMRGNLEISLLGIRPAQKQPAAKGSVQDALAAAISRLRQSR